jgi:hypothetical protein
MSTMYDGSGLLPSQNGAVNVLAGSTLGGGTKVNCECQGSLQTRQSQPKHSLTLLPRAAVVPTVQVHVTAGRKTCNMRLPPSLQTAHPKILYV